MCDVLIEGSAMQFLLDQLLSQPASLSDYTLRYAVAFLMNMSLRPSGRRRSALYPTPTLQVLTQLLEYDSAEVSTCVCVCACVCAGVCVCVCVCVCACVCGAGTHS